MNTEKKSRHVHADIIKAWLDGETIQYFSRHHEAWFDLQPAVACASMPMFNIDIKYRIKPKPVTIRYRVGLFKVEGVFYTNTFDTELDAACVEKLSKFVKWLTDWVEVEVPSDD